MPQPSGDNPDPVHRNEVETHEYEAAARRVQDRITFYEHFTWYFWINLLFVLLNATVTPDNWWCIYVGLFWGAGLLVHLVATFFIADLQGPFHRRSLQDELRHAKRRFLQ